MIRKPITIGISNGLEARPIAMLVQVASQYVSNIYLESEGNDEPGIGYRRKRYCLCRWSRRRRSYEKH